MKMIGEYALYEMAIGLGGWATALYYRTKSLDIEWSIGKESDGDSKGLRGTFSFDSEKEDDED